MVLRVMCPTNAEERARYPRKVFFSRRARGSGSVDSPTCARSLWDIWDLRVDAMEMLTLIGFMAANIADVCLL